MEPQKLIGKPSILDGVEDQSGAKWLRCGTSDRSVWVPLIEIGEMSRKTLERLHSVGFVLVTTPSKESFKRDAAAFPNYRRVPIAVRPGWTASTYARGDGSTHTLRGVHEEVIVAFPTDQRYAPSGSLEEWQNALTPVVRNQPLPLVVLSFAFVAPLLRFMPPDLQNPVIELVGAREQGKSSLAHAASAIFGGDPHNRMGTARSWNFSPERLDEMRAEFADGLLVLDEANLAGRSERDRAEKIDATIFRLAETAPRERFGQVTPMPVRLAALSTSNVAMSDLVGAHPEIKAAVVSRVLTLNANRAHGILDSVPAGLTAREATEAMTAASVRHAGTPGHIYIKRLVQHKSTVIERGVTRGMRRATAYFVSTGLEPRHAKIFATAYVAGRIAQELEIMPKSWGSVAQACKALVPSAPGSQLPAIALIRRYMEDYRAGIVYLDRRLSPEEFDETPGFVRNNGRQIVIPTKAARARLLNHEEIFQRLKDEGILDYEPGKRSKKAPRSLTSRRRAYFVRLD